MCACDGDWLFHIAWTKLLCDQGHVAQGCDLIHLSCRLSFSAQACCSLCLFMFLLVAHSLFFQEMFSIFHEELGFFFILSEEF